MSSGSKRRKAPSKKSKKSWRKTDVQDVEDFLDDKRLEERLGGVAFDEKNDEELFVVDRSSADQKPSVPSTRAERKKDRPLRCWKNLEITGGARDPKKGRNKRQTPEQRTNPALRAVKRQKEIRKAKEKVANHLATERIKKTTQRERGARRRTKFDFDLWNQQDEGDIVAVTENEWLEETTKTVNLTGNGNLRPKQPKTMRIKTSELEAVTLPHGGESYNPSLKDHQELLWRAALVEMQKENAKQKDECHTTKMFPDRDSAPTEQTRLVEMSAGLPLGEETSSDEESKEASDDDDEAPLKKSSKPKTRKQKRKEKEQKKAKFDVKMRRKLKLQQHDLLRVKSLKKQVEAREDEINKNMEKKAAKKALKMRAPAVLSSVKFEEQDLDVKLSDELTGNLRMLKPEGNLLVDRFKSLQRRNVIETRVKQKSARTRRNRKKVEKRSHKMGFKWEK